jgi:hypothetical protein
MTCPYCGKQVKDMVSHLEKSIKCQVAHAEKLLAQVRKLREEFI